MPGSVNATEAQGAPTIPASADFAACVIGYTSLNPIGSGPGPVSAPYSVASSLATSWGLGDAVDCATQAIVVTQGNPAPPPICIYQTPATTPGVRGTTLTTSGVTGTAAVSKTSGSTPKGTYEPVGVVVNGGTIGTAGIVIKFSPDGGRTFLASQALGTADTIEMQIGGIGTGVKYDFTTPSLSALYTALNNLRTAAIAHYIIVSGGTPVHAAADTADNVALTAIAVASTPATAVTLFNGILSTLGTHGASVVSHTTADTVLATALAALSVAVNVEDVELQLPALTAAYNAHRVLVGGGPVHGSADSTNTVTAFVAVPGTLVTGDTWSESKTTPPMWAVADLYTAGSPATGAFAGVGASATPFAVLVISEPVAVGDIATLSAGLNYLATLGKKPALLIRFRDPNAAETDAQYITAFQTYRASVHDNRISVVVGSGWLTDAYRGYRYFRSGLPAVLARMQSFPVIPGKVGERIAQSPVYVARGPLENFSIVDDSGNPISQAHDEAVAGGIDGPINGTGGGITFYYQRLDTLGGTYVSQAPVMYPSLSAVLTWMDRRILSLIELMATVFAWTEIGGADIFDTNNVLDPDIVDGLQAKIGGAIKTRYGHEFQNASDPNLVVINPTVTVSGSQVTINGVVNVRLFGYTNTINLTFSATR